jgi:hypothetical protein
MRGQPFGLAVETVEIERRRRREPEEITPTLAFSANCSSARTKTPFSEGAPEELRLWLHKSKFWGGQK